MDEAGDFQDNIRYLTVSGGTFTDVKGDVNHYHIRGNFLNHERESGRGIDKLSQVVSLSAIHDSSERYPPPRCHPETRTQVRALIIRWIEDPNPTFFVVWLYGPAGAGKSAILQSLAEECCSLEGHFGASFFFSRSKAGRNNGHLLFSTIAYQLALNLPYLRSPIDNAMQANPTLYTKSMMVQMRSLIINSFQKLSENVEHPPTIIIDGLDECDGHETQQVILEIIYMAVTIYKIPLRFLIASRPEAHIRETFDRPTLRSITKRIVLDESFAPSQDIEKYLRDGFKTIYEQNLALMEKVVQPWPGTGIVDLLVQKASGQFIYSSTVLKFVGAEYHNPISQLDIVLKPSSSNRTPFSDLDHLYSQILSTHPIPEKLISVLGVVLSLHCPQPPEVIEDLLGMKAGEVGLVLRGLHSLIKFPHIRDESFKKNGDDNGIRLLHESFRDYLIDENRSADFFINISLFRAQITKTGFQLMVKRISHCDLGTTRFPCTRTWGYLKWHLSPHYWESSEELRGDVVQLLLAHAESFRLNGPSSRSIFEPLHCAMTALAQMAFTKANWQRCAHDLEIDLDRTMKSIEEEDPDKKIDERLAIVLYKYRDILDTSYHLLLSESGDLKQLIQFAPGFLVLELFIPIPDMTRLLNVDKSSFLDLLERNRHFVNFFDVKDHAGPHSMPTSANSYATKIVPLVTTKILDLITSQSASRTTSGPSTIPGRILSAHRWYLIDFGKHLRATDIDPSEEILADHPIWSFLDHLCQLVYYLPSLNGNPFSQHLHAWSRISETLYWVKRHQELFRLSNIHGALEDKLWALTDRIYGQILCLDESHGNAVVTVCPPILAAIKYCDGESIFEVPIFEIDHLDDPCIVKATGVSRDLLPLETLYPSLTDYLTSQSRSKNFHVDAATYHTQMAEFLLNDLKGNGLMAIKNKNARTRWKFHLARARPTQRIFASLGALSPHSFIAASDQPTSDSFRAIIAWLESLPAPPLSIYLQYQKILLAVEEQEAGDATNVPVKGILETQARRPLSPTVIPQSIKDILGYLQEYVAMFVGWLVDK